MVDQPLPVDPPQGRPGERSPGPGTEDALLHEVFVNVLSHELRTPITSIYAGTQLLLHDGLPTEIRAGITRDIAAEAEHLRGLVEDLVAITRLEGGIHPLPDDPLLMPRLVRSAAGAEERRSPGRRVVVRVEGDLPAVRGDEAYVRQVLRNLMANALDGSPAGARVDVVISHGDGVVITRILDRSEGIQAEAGDDAFGLYHESPGVAARVTGTGIGLFVAKLLVEALRGRISLHVRPGGGQEIAFTLPVAPADAA